MGVAGRRLCHGSVIADSLGCYGEGYCKTFDDLFDSCSMICRMKYDKPEAKTASDNVDREQVDFLSLWLMSTLELASLICLRFGFFSPCASFF